MIIDQLKTLLANHIEGYLTVLGYHWNVEGADFIPQHNFLGQVYAEYQGQIDIIGELIRATDTSEYVNVSASIIKLNTEVKSTPHVGNEYASMISEVQKINNLLLNNLTDLFEEATKVKNYSIQDYASTRITALEKLNWLITASLKHSKE